MTDMPELLVPWPESDNWPNDIDSLRISPNIIQWYDGDLLKIMTKNWDAFGSGSTAAPPDAGSVPVVSLPAPGSKSEAVDLYLQKANVLKRAFDTLQSTYVEVAKNVKYADYRRNQGQKDVGNLIINLGDSASSPPPNPDMTENEHIMDYLTDGLNQAENIINNATKDQQTAAKGIEDQTGTIKDLQNQLQQLRQQVQQPPPPSTTTPEGLNLDPQDIFSPGSVEPLSPDLGMDGTDLSTTGNTTNTPDSSSNSDGLHRALDNLVGQAASNPNSAPSGMGVSSNGGPGMSGLSDMMGGLLPMIMAQMAQRDQHNPYGSGHGYGSEPDNPAAVSPPVAQSAQPAPARSATSARTEQAPQQSPTGPRQPSGPGSTQTRTPGSDGLVDYVYPPPDGRTQKVSPVVAQALDAAFASKAGTDAQAAYAKTSAKWSGGKELTNRVDPYQLKTGDVATWENRTALVVVFDTSDGGTLEVIVDGQKEPFTAQMSDTAGDFGQFTGFAHPKGVDVDATQDERSGETQTLLTPSVADSEWMKLKIGW
ncbi:hypothetical protein ACIBG0_37060 [Nocardia sp. NPDC050630]|uniref:hypothetical protein n=1 Tax=Nocardia sp. NPDC050630 TaxID=3364321 RepID=UPI00378CDF29